jgi:hypothetical protein
VGWGWAAGVAVAANTRPEEPAGGAEEAEEDDVVMAEGMAAEWAEDAEVSVMAAGLAGEDEEA